MLFPPDFLSMASHFLRVSLHSLSFIIHEFRERLWLVLVFFFFFQTVTPFEVTHPSDFAPTTKKLFYLHPSPNAVSKALHFYSPIERLYTTFKIQVLILCVESNFHVYCGNDTFVPTKVPLYLCRIFF